MYRLRVFCRYHNNDGIAGGNVWLIRFQGYMKIMIEFLSIEFQSHKFKQKITFNKYLYIFGKPGEN